MPLDPLTTYQFVWPLYTNLVTVTYTHLDTNVNPVGRADYQINFSREKKIHYGGERQRGSQTSSRYNRTVWQFQQSQMDAVGAPFPFINDLITGPDGEKWNILKVTRQEFNNIINCECQRIS